jgi:hypothetical protein
MAETVTFVVLLGVLQLALLACVPYAIWVIYSMFKRRWRRVGLQLAIPGVILLALAGAGAVWYSLQEDRLTSLFDCEVKLSPALFKYASERHFNGDGYSIRVYDLPATVRARFDSADQRLLTKYPKSSNIGDRWQTEHWQKTPFEGDFDDGLQLVLSNYDAKEAPELSSHLEAIREALDKGGSYYAFFYYRAIDRISDIDFFLVDLANNRLYIVNHNT